MAVLLTTLEDGNGFSFQSKKLKWLVSITKESGFLGSVFCLWYKQPVSCASITWSSSCHAMGILVWRIGTKLLINWLLLLLQVANHLLFLIQKSHVFYQNPWNCGRITYQLINGVKSQTLHNPWQFLLYYFFSICLSFLISFFPSLLVFFLLSKSIPRTFFLSPKARKLSIPFLFYSLLLVLRTVILITHSWRVGY